MKILLTMVAIYLQVSDVSSLSMFNNICLWPKPTIDYILPDHISYSADIQKNIREAFDIWENGTCLKFVNQVNNKKFVREPYIDISKLSRRSSKKICQASRGSRGKFMTRIKFNDNCIKPKDFASLIGKVLGFMPEARRDDRDSYVTIPKIFTPEISQWFFPPSLGEYKMKKIAVNSGKNKTDYDYMSIMHYDQHAKNYKNEIVITTKDPKYQDLIGATGKLSVLDKKLVNQIYCGAGKGEKPEKEKPLEMGGRVINIVLKVGESKIILSPGYNKNSYEDNQDVSLMVNALGSGLKFEVIDFNLSRVENAECRDSDLLIFEDYVTPDQKMMCGQQKGGESIRLSQQVNLNFVSDESGHDGRFKIKVTSTP